MPARLSLTNYAESLTPTSGPASAAGYTLADILHPTVAKAWLSNVATNFFQFVVDLGAPQLVQLIAGFDFRGAVKGAGQVTGIGLEYDSTGAGSWVAVSSPLPNSHGDWVLPDVGKLFQKWRVSVVMADGTDRLRAGLLWFGDQLIVPKQFAKLSVDPQRNNIINQTEGGGVFVAQLAGYQHHLTLSWGALRKLQRDALRAVSDVVSGSYKPFVLQPKESDPSYVYHGRITDTFATEEDGISISGAKFDFTESGRGI